MYPGQGAEMIHRGHYLARDSGEGRYESDILEVFRWAGTEGHGSHAELITLIWHYVQYRHSGSKGSAFLPRKDEG